MGQTATSFEDSCVELRGEKNTHLNQVVNDYSYKTQQVTFWNWIVNSTTDWAVDSIMD